MMAVSGTSTNRNSAWRRGGWGGRKSGGRVRPAGRGGERPDDADSRLDAGGGSTPATPACPAGRVRWPPTVTAFSSPADALAVSRDEPVPGKAVRLARLPRGLHRPPPRPTGRLDSTRLHRQDGGSRLPARTVRRGASGGPPGPRRDRRRGCEAAGREPVAVRAGGRRGGRGGRGADDPATARYRHGPGGTRAVPSHPRPPNAGGRDGDRTAQPHQQAARQRPGRVPGEAGPGAGLPGGLRRDRPAPRRPAHAE